MILCLIKQATTLLEQTRAEKDPLKALFDCSVSVDGMGCMSVMELGLSPG